MSKNTNRVNEKKIQGETHCRYKLMAGSKKSEMQYYHAYITSDESKIINNSIYQCIKNYGCKLIEFLIEINKVE